MKIKIFFNKSVNENAAFYYQEAKDTRSKLLGIDTAISQTKKEIEALGKKSSKKDVRHKRAKEWFEKFHWFITTGGFLAIGGRSAQQNDQVFSKHMEDGDLFFHADIQGGSAIVLKGGAGHGASGASTTSPVPDVDLKEAAQFAACFSNAWKNANAAVDVYAVTKAQLAKHVSGGFIPSGAFAITGERKWFRATNLKLKIGKDAAGGTDKDNSRDKDGGGRIVVLPLCAARKLESELELIPSMAGKDKGGLAKSLAKRFAAHPDDFLELLPNGKSKTVEPK